jgi:hypothetical protein
MRLTSTPKLLLVFGIALVLASCQKELSFGDAINNPGSGGGGTGNNTSITGNWDFVGMTAHTKSTVTATIAGEELKTITVSDYITKNNTGTVNITSNQFISSGLSYSIDTIMNVKTYISGVLFDDLDMPFVTSVPATGSTSNYVRNSNDSLTVTGSFGGTPNPSGNAPTGPVGIKISWAGDTLLLKVATTFTQSISQGGVPATFVGTVNGITKLKRH